MSPRSVCSLAAIGLIALPLAGARCHGAPVRVVLPAADVDRAGQVIELSTWEAAAAMHLEGADGQWLALDVASDGRARFVVPFQPAGTALTFHVAPGAGHGAAAGLAVEASNEAIAVAAGGRPVLEYVTRTGVPPGVDPVFARAAFIHPVHTPAGRLVTDAFPPNHLHQNGIWTAWTKTLFGGNPLDFWNLRKREGRIEFDRVERAFAGRAAAGFVARHRAVDIRGGEPRTVLEEAWRVSVYALPGAGAHVFDLEVSQTNVTSEPLLLETYHYGGLGFRGHRDWDGAPNTFFLTSEGETDRVKAHGTRMRWCHVGGLVGGERAGVAILGHPDNFRAPQPARVNPDEPFFCFTPAPLGPFTIEPGARHVMRYRFVAADGPPDARRIEAFWQGYARPAVAVVASGD